MTQAQLDLYKINGIISVDYQAEKKKVTCRLEDGTSMIVKIWRGEPVLIVKKGIDTIRIPLNVYESICDVKYSLLLFKSILEGQHSAHSLVNSDKNYT